MSEKQKNPYVYFQLKPFKENELGLGHWDTVMRNLASLGTKRVQFGIMGNHIDIKFYAKVPTAFKTYFMNTFFSNFPTSDIEEIDNPTTNPLVKPIAQPVVQTKRFLRFKEKKNMLSKDAFTKDGSYMDPLRDVMAIFSSIEKNSVLDIQFTYFFAREKGFWEKFGELLKKIFASSKPVEKVEKSDDEKLKEKEKSREEIYMSVGYVLGTTDQYTAQAVAENIKSTFTVFAQEGGVDVKEKPTFKHMNIDQAINVFHMPTKENFFKGLDYVMYKKLPYPNNLPTPYNTPAEELTLLGRTDYRGGELEFGIKREDKFRHMYIIGKTGTGKTTFISNMIKSDMDQGKGLCLLDPHGDLVDKVVEFVPNHRINDVILFDVSDSDFPIGFNLLQSKNEDEKVRIVSGVVTAFNKLFEHSRGPRLEYILRNVLLSIVDYPNATIMHILRVLTDKEFRDEVIRHIQDPMVLKFWQNEFLKRNDKQREEAVGPITNKVGQFLSSKIVRNIFGQPRTKLSLREAMDQGKIILVNLSKGKIGEDNASMIGSLLVTKFQIDAMSRADIPEHQRREFYLYIDEFQNFATTSFATILSEARKYKLSLIVANQFTAQIQEEVRQAIFGNVGTILSLTLGRDDAEVISGQFKEVISASDAISIPKLHGYVRMMIDGHTGDPFTMKFSWLPTPDDSIEKIEKIRKQSRQRYAIEKDRLERLLDAWNKKTFSQQEVIAEKAKLEGYGVTEQEIANLRTDFVQGSMQLFGEWKIEGEEPDAIVFDTENKFHKVIFYKTPAQVTAVADLRVEAGSQVSKNDGTFLTIYADMYQHKHRENENEKPVMLRVGSKENILKQLAEGYVGADYLLFAPNIDKLEKLYGPKSNTQKNTSSQQANTQSTHHAHNTHNTQTTQSAPSANFTVNDIKVGERYEGYVKLSYNYGVFVTVKGVEGLLHKNFIIAPDGVERKKYFNIGDKIRIKAEEFKDIKGEKRVVRSMK